MNVNPQNDKLNIAQKDHQLFLEYREQFTIPFMEFQNRKFRKQLEQQIKFMEDTYKIGIDKAKIILSTMKMPTTIIDNIENKRTWSYAKWLYKESNHRFYIFNVVPPNSVYLMARNREACIILKTCTPGVFVQKNIGNQIAIEIDSFHSVKKGEGYKIMKNVLAFAERHKYPVTLWTETEQNVKYFERYGFKNYGRLGENNEYLMIKGE